MLNYKTITEHNLNNCMGYYLNFDQNKCMRWSLKCIIYLQHPLVQVVQ